MCVGDISAVLLPSYYVAVEIGYGRPAVSPLSRSVTYPCWGTWRWRQEPKLGKSSFLYTPSRFSKLPASAETAGWGNWKSNLAPVLFKPQFVCACVCRATLCRAVPHLSRPAPTSGWGCLFPLLGVSGVNISQHVESILEGIFSPQIVKSLNIYYY